MWAPVASTGWPSPGSAAAVKAKLAASIGADQVAPWSTERAERRRAVTLGAAAARSPGSSKPSTKTSGSARSGSTSSWWDWCDERAAYTASGFDQVRAASAARAKGKVLARGGADGQW